MNEIYAVRDFKVLVKFFHDLESGVEVRELFVPTRARDKKEARRKVWITYADLSNTTVTRRVISA